MAEVKSGSFETTGYSDAYSPDHYVFSWSLSSQSIVDNTSTITWSVVAAGGVTAGYYNTVREKYVTVYGVTKSASEAQVTYNGTTPFTGTTIIKHDINGKGSFTASCGGAFEYGGAYNSTGSGSWDLPTIARATTPKYSATTTNLGTAVTLTLTPATSSFKHKVSYAFGTLTNQTTGVSIGSGFSAAGNTTVTFTPPTSLGSQIPTAMSGICTVTCYTYTSTGSLVGSVTSNITLNIPSYTPTVTGITLTGNNLLSSTYVSGKSTVTVNATVGTSYGANAKTITATIDGKTFTELPFTTSTLTSGSKTVQITFVDSRGKSVTVTSSAITVYDYDLPNITTFSLARQTDGTTIIATVKGSIASVNTKNAKNIKVTLNGITNTITSSSYTIDATTTFTGISTDKTFIAKAVFTDSYVSVEREAILPTIAVTMDFYNDGKGIALGKVAETSDLLDVAWSQRIRKNLTVDGTLKTTGTHSASAITASGNISGVNISASGTAVVNGATTLKSNVDITGNIYMGGSKTSTVERSIIFSNPDNSTYPHNVYIYGGNPASKSAIGIFDTAKNRTVLLYNDTDNVLNFGSNETGIKFNDTQMIDFVVEQGTSGIWDYRKWNNGFVECWANVGTTATVANGTNTVTVTLPFTFKDTSYKVFITPSMTAQMLGFFGDCGSNGMASHTTTSFVFSYKYNYATLYNLNFNVEVKGKWK